MPKPTDATRDFGPLTTQAARHPSQPQWTHLEASHQSDSDTLTATHRLRKQRGERHPVEDFLWTYYSVKPAELRRWHPGAGVTLEGAAVERAGWRYYATKGDDAFVDVPAFFSKRGATVDYIEELFNATLEHTPHYGCFGLHEWAMVYRLTPDQIRNSGLPLRIGHEATDLVVEQNPIACSHFDAYRFFTPAAAPLNELRPTRENQPQTEQSACLHAGMDVYKWAAKLGPLVPGDLLLDAFELARDIREVDMRASPYDVSSYSGADGQPLTAVKIEIPEGKREYAELQRAFAERGNALRERVLAAISLARTFL